MFEVKAVASRRRCASGNSRTDCGTSSAEYQSDCSQRSGGRYYGYSGIRHPRHRPSPLWIDATGERERSCFAEHLTRVRDPREAIARGVFLVPENPARDGVVAQMSIAQNITLVDLPAITRFGILQLKEESETARKYVSMLRIAAPSAVREVAKLSGGNQQKVLLAKALQAKAQLLILEEPTQGVDVNAKEEIHRIVQELGRNGKGRSRDFNRYPGSAAFHRSDACSARRTNRR